MTLDIRWLAPAIVFSGATPQCIAAQYMSVDQARSLIFAQAQEFIPHPVDLTPDQSHRIEELSGVKTRMLKQPVWKAMAGGKFLGWFIIDQVIGKHELITYAVGINPEGTLRQFQVIEYREAWGGHVKELKWRDQFVGKTTADPLKVGNDIVNVSGGTMSSNSMANGIKRLLFLHQVVLH
ncbi:MAG: FMN-binding protein [Betaproteobacteria bacterium]|nr:FMN-binding protein [Betaproteobacteria bacterium]